MIKKQVIILVSVYGCDTQPALCSDVKPLLELAPTSCTGGKVWGCTESVVCLCWDDKEDKHGGIQAIVPLPPESHLGASVAATAHAGEQRIEHLSNTRILLDVGQHIRCWIASIPYLRDHLHTIGTGQRLTLVKVVLVDRVQGQQLQTEWTQDSHSSLLLLGRESEMFQGPVTPFPFGLKDHAISVSAMPLTAVGYEMLHVLLMENDTN